MREEDKAKIIQHYNKCEGSIQDLARVYRYSVEEVLEVLGLSDITTVEGVGDMVDQAEAGPGVELKHSNTYQAKFTTN